ncbi:carboxyl transferase domain-containing protein [Streptomyces sp. NPDC097619]|uniref:carboxyl transferase domain-containing protein n=1 Tax=Streptomyces sp. NPDC097619 TaxID=3157228 RepID=UPI00332316CC
MAEPGAQPSPAGPGPAPAAPRLSAREALAAVTDPGSFTELPAPAVPPGPTPADGPLGWEGYDDSRARAADRTGEEESVVCGTARIGGRETVLVSFEFLFLGGSLGQRTGDRLEAAYALARARRLPLVSLIATGGSRMQEGMLALTQLQRVARQSVLTRSAGLPQLAVLRDPTTGGGWATLGAGADVVLALPGAQVGFAGSRVRPADADPAAYTAESQYAGGHVDEVVPAARLRAALADWLLLLAPGPAGPAGPGFPAGAGAGAEGEGTPEPAEPPAALAAAPEPASGWEAVRQARHPGRPRADAYLDSYFELRRELSGDRAGGTDPGVRCGFGLHQGRTVAYAAQCGTATRPAGYRTATRLISLADRLGIPVLTLVDTPGAANDAVAERAGAGAAIAGTFAAVAGARVPVTTLLIGEGGSGGALALAAPGNTWVTPDSYFSVIAPELATAILKRPADQAPRTADQLRLRPQDLVELGVARGVVAPA